MKKILLIGKFNKEVQNLNEYLSKSYNIQICAESMELIQGMMKIVQPDMVLLCLVELEEIDTKILELFKDSYSNVPVLFIETEEGYGKHRQYYIDNHFTYLISPVKNETILNKCHELTDITQADEIKRLKTGNKVREQKQILVVDDSALALRSMKALLGKMYDVSVATSGEQAIKTIRKNPPDLILLDYEMPGCDGKKTLERIREDKDIQDIPVIFLTSVADKEHIAAVLGLNPAGYFLKPPERGKLLEAIENILK